MELGQGAQQHGIVRQLRDEGRDVVGARIGGKGFVDDPEQVGTGLQQAAAGRRRQERAGRIARIGQPDGCPGRDVRQQGEQLPEHVLVAVPVAAHAAVRMADLQPGQSAGQGVFAEGRFDHGRAGSAVFLEDTGQQVDELVGAVTEHEAVRRQAVDAGGGLHGLFRMGGRIGRDMVQGATKRQTQEFRRAFGTDVDAEIQQAVRGAPG